MSVRAMTWAWEQSIPPNGKIVLLALADHAHDDGRNAYPSLGRLARKTGYSDRQVQRILTELCRTGLIAVQAEATPNRPTAYLLRIGTEFSISRDDFRTGSATPELRHALIVRDGFRCRHCGRAGDEVTDPDGFAWEADRVGEGGEYGLANCVLSCRGCNRRGVIMSRGDDILTEGGDTDVSSRGDTDVSRTINITIKEPSTTARDAGETEGRRVNRLTTHYSERVPMCRFPAIAGIVKTAVRAGYADEQIIAALLRLADQRRSVTVESMRIELEGGKMSGSEMYARAASTLGGDYGRPAAIGEAR